MKPRILFVEDEPEYFGPLIEALQKGYQLERAEDLTEAVEILSAEDFALIIVDIMLPIGTGEFPGIDNRRSGVHLIRLVRKKPPDREIELKCRQDVRILALTAVSDLSVQDDLKALNVPMVPKPFSVRAVLERIANMLKEVHSAS